METNRCHARAAFTLIELLVVMAIISILLGFVLRTAMDGVRRAEERATQGLIMKLETGLSDRIEALLQVRPSPTTAHYDMAAIQLTSGQVIPGPMRAQVIANYDYMKAEIPDVFYVPSAGDPVASANYPINFAMPRFGGTGTDRDFMLPLDYSATRTTNTGMVGASLNAAAGLYKGLGYTPRGTDGVDNDGNGFIDDWNEGIRDASGAIPTVSDPDVPNGPAIALDTLIKRRLAVHTHKTARAEALYAFLIEGSGSLGSVFNRDDFTDREVQDTDHDGLPEFVDAWGEPLYFYRWPIFYHSDVQKGFVPTGPYGSVYEIREQDPIDPNQQLLAPSWWSAATNTGPAWYASPGVISGGAAAFTTYFHTLVEPMASGAANPNAYWDRGTTYYQRRAFYSKFLIVSSGPDRELGIARLDTLGVALTVPNLLIESQARQTDLNTTAIYQAPTSYDPTPASTGNPLSESALDDISTHSLLTPSGLQ
jgi:prepilin-type N-terminal cleavage/methylation domain-containing protein